MNVVYYELPFPHAVIENFYGDDELDLIWDELKFLTHPAKMLNNSQTESALDINSKPLKNNYGLFLDEIYLRRDVSNILNLSRKLYSKEVQESIGLNNVIGKFISACNRDTTLLSYYESGGSYAAHPDRATLTACTWIFREPKQFVGGHFSFTEYKHPIPLENNKMVIFPSVYLHEVESVMMTSDETQFFSGDGRYVITNFLKIV